MPRGAVGARVDPGDVLETLRRVLEKETEVKKSLAEFRASMTLPSWLRRRPLIVYKGRRFYLFIVADEADENQ